MLPTIALWHATDANKWCSKRLCNGKHTLCRDHGRYYPTCPSHATSRIRMQQDFKDMIVNKHNDYRNKFAGGLANNTKAARMPFIKWDDELAAIADSLVRRCQPSRDKCAVSEKMYHSAEVSFALEKYYCMTTKKAALKKQLNTWFDPLNHLDKAPNLYFTTNAKNLGHSIYYYQVLRDRANRVGCALVEYIRPALVHQLLKCVYNCGVTPCYEELNPVYEHTNNKAGEACETGTHDVYTNLCSAREPMKLCGDSSELPSTNPTIPPYGNDFLDWTLPPIPANPPIPPGDDK
ncbi:LOW QUALITY PROTEIN: uncharacterized protein Dana_GF15450, partial [Drosophila ananassae]